MDLNATSIPSLPRKLLVAGGMGGTNVGESLQRAATRLGIHTVQLNTRDAYAGSRLWQLINWHLRGKRPVNQHGFEQKLLQACREERPDVLLTTGLAPLSASVLKQIGALGVRRINFLTDDPWNPAHRAEWFLAALPQYDLVCTPRRAMEDDLQALGCRQIRYVPFGYDEELFFAPSPADIAAATTVPAADVSFAGGADPDRVPYMQALLDAGFTLALYGDYWRRHAATRHIARGIADVATVRVVVAKAKVSLCLVRRANRDGNCMRTFEVPAIGGCMLLEDTAEHREIFGAEGINVLYFADQASMIEQTRRLCNDAALRQRLAANAHQLMMTGGHTYRDRLISMLLPDASCRMSTP
ncbi:MAG: glycosyltransferase [Pseudomonadota bacterium]